MDLVCQAGGKAQNQSKVLPLVFGGRVALTKCSGQHLLNAVLWEEEMKAAHDRKKERFVDLAAAYSQAGWRALTFLVEVGCRGFTDTTMKQILKTLGFRGYRKKT